MRTLERNKTKLWLVYPVAHVPLLDSEGFDTGETTINYSEPKAIDINIYPSGGSVAIQIFGKDASLDMIAVSNDIVLTKASLLFLSEPTGNFGTTYDYRIDKINSSLNTHNYGLRNRT